MEIYSKGIYIDLSQLGCEYLGKETVYSDPEIKYYQNNERSVEEFVSSVKGKDSLSIRFLISASSHEQVVRNIKKFTSSMINCVITLDEEPNFEHHCTMASINKEFISPCECELQFDFSDYVYSKEISKKLISQDQIIKIDGCAKTPINFEIVAKEDVKNVRLNDFLIKKLDKGKTLIIDSNTCLILVDDTLYTRYVEFTEFPEVLGNFEIKISSPDVDIYIHYKERW